VSTLAYYSVARVMVRERFGMSRVSVAVELTLCLLCNVTSVAEEDLSALDSVSRLAHYVCVFENKWTSVDKGATELRNELDETLEVCYTSFNFSSTRSVLSPYSERKELCRMMLTAQCRFIRQL